MMKVLAGNLISGATDFSTADRLQLYKQQESEASHWINDACSTANVDSIESKAEVRT
jgi:hypothetical protein